jgi:hypothetical protein
VLQEADQNLFLIFLVLQEAAWSRTRAFKCGYLTSTDDQQEANSGVYLCSHLILPMRSRSAVPLFAYRKK